jgi:ubiquinone/menaquinone biosynthesis C-methylase UbiE
MGFYDRWIVPRLIDLAMRNQRLHSYRQQAIGAASGFVLEIGVGSGLNLPLYGPEVGGVCAIDPSPELLGLARTRIAEASVPVRLVQASGESLPFAGASFDTVLTTWTLCSIPHPQAALGEMRRVLKPTGKLVFVEHGLSPEPRVAHWQHLLTPLWRRVSGGCHLDRDMDELIRAAGFHLDAIETGYMNGPKLMTFIYQGQANAGEAAESVLTPTPL